MDSVIIDRIVQDTGINQDAVTATIGLFEKGATTPFIIHYRKEVTGGLDESKVRAIQERMVYYREVLDRRNSLLKMLAEQGKLTDELKTRIESTFSKPDVDDLHYHFRPRKRTRAEEAMEKGLAPLAEYLVSQEQDALTLEQHLDACVDPEKKVTAREQALQGAIDIIAEAVAENIDFRKALRERLWNEGVVVSGVVPAKAGQKTKYNMYYDRREPVTTIPSHRVLAIRRGSKEGILTSSIEGDSAKAIEFLCESVIREKESIFAPALEAAVRESYNRYLKPSVEIAVRGQLKERADREAIRVFQENLANLLLSPPAGAMVVMGIDWGKGNECRVVVVGETGAFKEGASIRLVPPKKAAPKGGPHKNREQKAVSAQSAQSSGEEESPQPVPAHEVDQVQDAPALAKAEGSSFASTPVSQPVLVVNAAEGQPEAPQIEVAVQPPAEVQAVVDVVQEPPTEPPPPETQQEASQPAEIESPAQPAELPGSEPVEDEPEEAPAAEPEAAVITDAPPAEAFVQAPSPEPTETEQTRDYVAEARATLIELIRKHEVRAVAIGAGNNARELQIALRQFLADEQLDNVLVAAVSDAGLAIYSSSRAAREEFPDWNASARCAISLARRLQDPLSELVKIDPKLIGVGQYQHDVDQKELHRGLLQTVQVCVNQVGVNPNTANESLVHYVAGLNDRLARRIVGLRASQGPFPNREALLQLPGIDANSYEQAAGFLRMPDSSNPLDRTAVHPESYAIVEKMAASAGVGASDLIENRPLIESLKLEEFVTDTAGIPTLTDIREELLRPGRDPRRTFAIPKFRSDVTEISDLKQGMVLEGTVTNVTNFGAFVDIGVRQDGLVHLSQMSNRFIRDPREAVKVGDVVQVKVISVELETKRIGLSIKAALPPAQKKQGPPRGGQRTDAGRQRRAPGGEAGNEGNPHTRDRGEHGRRRRRGYPENEQPGAQPLETEHDKPKVSEQTLQEKIAILQSKFRGIK